MQSAALHRLFPDRLAGVRIDDTPEGLSAIHAPDCAAAIWQRKPLPGFQAWMDQLSPAQLPRTRLILRPAGVREAVRHACDAAATPDGEDRTRLIDDIAALAEIFAGVMRTPYLRLRLDVVTTNACRKFHVDAVTARLVCTYRGTGTQYGIGRQNADPQPILTLPTGTPILLRGTRWPEQPRSGLLHRSPPIGGSGESRLLLVLDPILDPEDEI
ncbi:DUF1826 domain-containing protein [Aliiroseovarius sp.]|uniref:DUF1826 domain-containing protein n=1 Tax=Aliiroseovarius sp. TaxID=1872442 RepID=UPI003BA9EA0A